MTLPILAEQLARQLAADPAQIRLVSRSIAAALIVQLGARLAMDEPGEGGSATPKLLTVREAADLLRIATGTLEHKGAVQPFASFRVKIGRRTLYDAARIADWLRDPDGYRSCHAGPAPTRPAGPGPRPAAVSSPRRQGKDHAMKLRTGKVYQRRGSAWWIAYRCNGREYRESVGRALGLPPRTATKQDGEALLTSRLQEVYNQRLIEPTARRVTVAALLDALETDYEVRGIKSLVWMKRQVGYVRAAVGAMQAQMLTPPVLATFAKQWQARGLAPATVRDRLATLGRALRLGVQHRQVREAPIMPRIEVRNARLGFIEPGEFEAIAAGCSHVYGEVVRFAWLTAWRQGEILGLTWDQVGRGRAELRLETTKNGDVRTLPVGGLVKGILDARWNNRVLGSPYVFHRHGKPLWPTILRRVFREAAKRAGYPGLIFHDLRRSAVRNMERAGVLRTVAMRISGHRSEAVYRRYAIVSTEDVAQAMARTEAYVTEQTADKTRTIGRSGTRK